MPLLPRAFQRFFQAQALGGLLLVVCGLAALSVANSSLAHAYHDFWDTVVVTGLTRRPLALTVHQWINDGLMAIFFLLVGLEIKRELIAGELALPRQAALPIAGALGGMIAPALLFWLLNPRGAEAAGWGIPMATDIAFALGALSLIAPNIPTGAKVFLAALAIVDDMGAVLVIALFYSASIAWGALALAALIVALLATLNLAGVGKLWPYLALGAILWFFVHQSGVHATIAGVVLAFTIPTNTRINAVEFSREARALLDEFDRTETGDFLVLTSKGQQEALFALERASEGVLAPLQRLEHSLHKFSAFVVMPIFAFANAGVSLGADIQVPTVTLGVLAGLVVGKPLGIMLAAALAVRTGLAALPDGVHWPMLHGVSWLGGIGFTMSLFIAMLAFDNPALLDSAKIGILGASLVAALIATVLLRFVPGPNTSELARDHV
jgi:NhaA family Na+:H+ antiporter